MADHLRVRRPHHRARTLGATLAGTALAFSGLALVSPTSAAAANGVISGTVYRDADNDGVFDSREDGVAGVVIDAGNVAAVTDASGEWTIRTSGIVQLQASTGWYRSRCNSVDCAPISSRDQDFSVVGQAIVAPRVDASTGAVLHLGLAPDWPGTYPIPANPTANQVDVAGRLTWLAAAGADCSRTTNEADRACAIGDAPRFLLQVLNEGTTTLGEPAGYLQLPAGTTVTSIRPSTSPSTHPSMDTVWVGALHNSTHRVPVTLHGSCPKAARRRSSSLWRFAPLRHPPTPEAWSEPTSVGE